MSEENVSGPAVRTLSKRHSSLLQGVVLLGSEEIRNGVRCIIRKGSAACSKGVHSLLPASGLHVRAGPWAKIESLLT